jgi:hypothetical protein
LVVVVGSGSGLLNVTVTRRFLRRPSSVLLEATGSFDPCPATWKVTPCLPVAASTAHSSSGAAQSRPLSATNGTPPLAVRSQQTSPASTVTADDAEAGGEGDVPLHAGDETLERVGKAAQEGVHVLARQLLLHHRKAHQVQAEVGGDGGQS